MNEFEITEWMHEKIKIDGFTDAMTLAESFLKAHGINDALDPVFSRSLDVGFKVAQQVRDQKMALAG